MTSIFKDYQTFYNNEPMALNINPNLTYTSTN